MKTIKTILIIIIILVLIPLTGRLLWIFKQGSPLNILVVNKTVLNLTRKEHKALFWLLIQDKYVKPDNKVYNINRDYFGFHPVKPEKSKKYDIVRIKLTDIENLAEEYDMTYYADTYGVFFNEWYRAKGIKDKGTLIEGGLNNNDYLFLKKMRDKGKLIIGEYNFFAPPTDDLVKIRTEELFGLKWSGWIGKYIRNLNQKRSKDLPTWVVDMYKSKYKSEWQFEGEGIIFVNQASKDVVVLEAKMYLDIPAPEIQTTEFGKSHFELPENVYFSNWFDITYPQTNNVDAEYKIHINIAGKSILDKYNLPSRFPAVIESADGSPFFYFTGDFSEYPVKMCTAKLKGVNVIKNLFYNDKHNNSSKFYWTYYQPLLNQIFQNYKNTPVK